MRPRVPDPATGSDPHEQGETDRGNGAREQVDLRLSPQIQLRPPL